MARVVRLRRMVAMMYLVLLLMLAFHFALPSAVQTKPYGGSPPSAEEESSPKSRPFSELTLFLFGSGLALFVALLGWSDQIRGIDKDTRELETKFLTDTGIKKEEFMAVVRPKSADDRLLALAEVMSSGKLKSVDSVRLMGVFSDWNKEWSRLERVAGLKYDLAIALTVALFLAGIVSLFTNPREAICVLGFPIRVELLVLLFPLLLIAIVLGIIIYSGQREKSLRKLLKTMEGMV